jgi:hypothetical protein
MSSTAAAIQRRDGIQRRMLNLAWLFVALVKLVLVD